VSELFDEVDEEVRREQLKKLWDKYSLYIIAVAILIVAAVGGWRGYQYLEAKKAAEAGAAFEKAVENQFQAPYTMAVVARTYANENNAAKAAEWLNRAGDGARQFLQRDTNCRQRSYRRDHRPNHNYQFGGIS